MYRNITYNQSKKEIVLFSWNDRGERTIYKYPFKPYLYIEHEESKDAISIYNTPLKKMEFETDYKRREFIKTSGIKRIFFNLPAEQQFLLEKYQLNHNSPSFSKFPLKNYFIDIETDSRNEFPDPKTAKDVINVINIYDSLTNQFHIFGLKKDYKPKESNVNYYKFESEIELLSNFIKFWKSDYCDFLIGWNSESFDIPYIINRIGLIIGENAVQKLSPIGSVYLQENVQTKFGNMVSRWKIKGISCFDYMNVYKIFSTTGEKSSYSLNYISEEELGKGKLEYNATSLSELADKDWEKYIDYNIQDVKLIIELDDKFQYLNIIRMLSYMGLSTFESALGTISIVTGAVASKALSDNKIIPTFLNQDKTTYVGGFVKEPVPGMYNNIVSYDINSLYPNTIITLNISQETKLGKITKIYKDKNQILVNLNNKEKLFNKDLFYKFTKNNKISISSAGVLYNQNKKGLFPELIDIFYDERIKIQKKLIEFKKEKKQLEDNKNIDNKRKIEKLNKKILQYDILQKTYKLFLNKIYGTFGNKYSPFYDIENASSVTATGRSCIKSSQKIVNEYIKNKYNLPDKDYIVASDTDSIYVTIEDILKKLNIQFTINNKINSQVIEIVEDLDNHLNIEIKKWGEKQLNSNDCRFKFKRETICNVGMFLTKKRYILHVLKENEFDTNEIKYTGVEIKKSDVPKKVKPLMKDVIETIIKTNNINNTDLIFKKSYNEFKKLNIEDIAFPKGIKNFEKYNAQCNGFNIVKGCPIHVKASIYYNNLIDKYKLNNKYEKIKSGQKIKYFYVKPNSYNIDVIAFNQIYPKEFNFEINYDLMFEKILLNPLKRYFDILKWNIKNPNNNFSVDILSILN